MKRTILCALAFALLVCPVAWSQRQAGFSRHEVQFVDDLGRPIEVSTLYIYLANSTTNATIYMDRGLTTAITVPMTEASTNTTLTDGYCYWYGVDAWEFSVTTDDGRVVTSASAPSLSGSITQIVIPIWYAAVNTAAYSDTQTISLGNDNDWVLAGGVADLRLTFTPVADDAMIWFGTSAGQTDMKWWSGTNTTFVVWDQADNSVTHTGVSNVFDDASFVKFGTHKDFTFSSSTTKNLDILPLTTDETSIINIGADTAGADLKLFGATTLTAMQWDSSANELLLTHADVNCNDNSIVYFGTNKDFSMKSATTTVLDILPVTTDESSTVNFGADSAGVNMFMYPATTGDYMKFVATGSGYLGFEDTSISMGDATKIKFGDALGTGDLYIESTSNVLTVGQVVAGTGSVAFGANDAGVDVTFYGDTASEYVKWTAADDTFSANAGNILFTMTDAEVDQFKVDATGTGAGFAIVLETTNGGIQLNADGAANGDITIDAADALILNSTGDSIFTVASGAVAATDLHLTQTGAVDSSIILTAAGTGTDAISLQAGAGSIDIDAASAKDVTITGGQVAITGLDNAAGAISLTTNTGTTETITVTNTAGTGVGAITLTSTAGGITMSSLTPVLLTMNAKTKKYREFPVSYVSATEARVGGGTAAICVGLAAGADATGAVEGFVTMNEQADFLRMWLPMPTDFADDGVAASLQLEFDITEVTSDHSELNLVVNLYEYGNTSPILTDSILVAHGTARGWKGLVTKSAGFGDDADIDLDDSGYYVVLTLTGDTDDVNVFGARWKYRVGVGATQ
jgi:hypothetical protein